MDGWYALRTFAGGNLFCIQAVMNSMENETNAMNVVITRRDTALVSTDRNHFDGSKP